MDVAAGSESRPLPRLGFRLAGKGRVASLAGHCEVAVLTNNGLLIPDLLPQAFPQLFPESQKV